MTRSFQRRFIMDQVAGGNSEKSDGGQAPENRMDLGCSRGVAPPATTVLQPPVLGARPSARSRLIAAICVTAAVGLDISRWSASLFHHAQYAETLGSLRGTDVAALCELPHAVEAEEQ